MACTSKEDQGIYAVSFLGTERDPEIPSTITGPSRLNHKRYNKGLAFTHQERQMLGIHGLLPVAVKSEHDQVEQYMALLDLMSTDLEKYIFLSNVAEQNEHLFYKLFASNITKMLPCFYSPTVGAACTQYSLIYHRPRGLFISIKDKGHVLDVLKSWPESYVRAICVTDGERILGLGDIGANGMGVAIGKVHFFTALGGIKPYLCMPILLDVGTNTQKILDDPQYIGLRQKRVNVGEYDELLDELMDAVVRRFGPNCVIQYEDFGNSNAYRLLAKYRDRFCMFNDDIQCSAAAVLAGLLSTLKIKKTKLKEDTFLFQGAGSTGLGVANLCVVAMMKEGLSEEDARKRIWLVDSKGLIVKDRPAGGLTERKMEFAHNHAPVNSLAEAVHLIKPTVLIGASSVYGAFTQEILETMAELNDLPIIFALSNPTSKVECTAEQAYTHTKGKCIFVTGSPFPPLDYNGKIYYTSQANNAYVYPGVTLGVLCSGMLTIPEPVFLIAAEALAELCTQEELCKGCLYPPGKEMGNCSIAIAKRVMDYAYENCLSTVCPEPKDKVAYIKSQMYDPNYPPAVPEIYKL